MSADEKIFRTYESYRLAHQTYYGVCVIGDLAEGINRTTFANTLGTLQGELADLMYVRLAALFQKPGKPRTTSIPELVLALKSEPPESKNRSAEFLAAYGRADITEVIADPWQRLDAYVSSEMHKPEFLEAFALVRKIRDKRIAHIEAKDIEDAAKYEQADLLFQVARRSIHLAAAVFYNENLGPHSELAPGGDLKRSGLKRLIQLVVEPKE